MRDLANEQTEKLIEEAEKRIRKEYQQATAEVKAKLDDYFRRFKVKDEAWQKMVANGEKTKAEYMEWRKGQLLIGKRWEELKDTLAEDLHKANLKARNIANGYRAEAYALNHNYATFQVEKGAMVDTSYSLYNRATVEKVIKEDPELLPAPGAKMKKRLAEGKDIAWQKGQLQSVTLQSILQGESIPNMAKRIARTMGESDHKATIRYARTTMTSAQNAGRLDAYQRASEMGIKMKKTWVATLDSRTRHDHRVLDGQTVDIDKPFVVDGRKIMSPGDPSADADLIWNCRCTMIAQIDGFERNLSDLGLRHNSRLAGMSYEQWEKGHGVSQSITKQEKIAENMRRRYNRELYGGGSGEKKQTANGSKTPEKDSISKQKKTFSFTPAATKEEAESYISQFVDSTKFGAVGVDYTGVSVDVANEINKTLGFFFDAFDVEKFGGIVAPAGNTKLGKAIQNATAGYSDIRKSIILNRKSLKTKEIADKAFAKEKGAIADILSHPEKYDMDKASAQLKRIIENSRTSGRGTIPETIEEAINHELGHSLEKKVKKHPLYETIKEKRKEFGQLLSGYACENESEYIAESFCSYMKGENLIDPVMRDVFESLRKK